MSKKVLIKIILGLLVIVTFIYLLNFFKIGDFLKNTAISNLIIFGILFDFSYIFYRASLLFLNKRRIYSSERPLVSILIPAYNEEICIEKTLNSCLFQTYPNFEIIVINDGSVDKTLEVVDSFIKKQDYYIQNKKINFVVIDKPNQGKAVALNSGKDKANGDFLVTIDADSHLSSHAVEKIMNYFTSEDIGAVAGNVVAIYKDSILGYLQKIEYEMGIYFIRASQSFFGNVLVTPGALSAYRKSAIKNFEEGTLTEDFDSSVRILEKGYKIIMAPDAVCYTQVPLGVSDLIKQRIRWQEGSLEVFSKHSFHRKSFLVSLEWFFLLLFGFYPLMVKFVSLFALPLFLISGDYLNLLHLILLFLSYSVFSYFILFSIVAYYSHDKKSLLAVPLYVIYFNTVVLYSVLVAQILIFKGKNQTWGKIKRYHI